MGTIEHAPPQTLDAYDSWTRTAPSVSAAPEAVSTDQRRSDAWDVEPEARSPAAATFGAIRLVFLGLIAFAIIAPFAPGLVLLALVGAVLAVPYVIIRRLVGDR